ncbi:hypothetical protein BaRGS_00039910, partial [Batillaria attramentaria]
TKPDEPGLANRCIRRCCTRRESAPSAADDSFHHSRCNYPTEQCNPTAFLSRTNLQVALPPYRLQIRGSGPGFRDSVENTCHAGK